jgi:hypothetical protein|tara:strand:- start:13 stop:117 length:105 start_codon:yes stop_codon:yes gene_type:complete
MAMKDEIFVVESVDLWLDFLLDILNQNMTAKRRG